MAGPPRPGRAGGGSHGPVWNKSFAGRNSAAITAVVIVANLPQGKFEKTPLLTPPL